MTVKNYGNPEVFSLISLFKFLRYENQIREEEASFQQLRHRLYQEVEDEKERLSKRTQQLNNEFEEKKSAYEVSFKQTHLSMQEEHLKKLEQSQQQHLVRIIP